MKMVGLGVGWIVMLCWEGDRGLKRERTMSLQGICSVPMVSICLTLVNTQILPFCNEEQPIEPASPRRLDGIKLQIRLLLLQSQYMRKSRCLAQMEPSLVV